MRFLHLGSALLRRLFRCILGFSWLLYMRISVSSVHVTWGYNFFRITLYGISPWGTLFTQFSDIRGMGGNTHLPSFHNLCMIRRIYVSSFSCSIVRHCRFQPMTALVYAQFRRQIFVSWSGCLKLGFIFSPHEDLHYGVLVHSCSLHGFGVCVVTEMWRAMTRWRGAQAFADARGSHHFRFWGGLSVCFAQHDVTWLVCIRC